MTQSGRAIVAEQPDEAETATRPVLTDVSDFLFALEAEFKLVDRPFYGAPTWAYLRNVVCNILFAHIGAYSNKNTFRETPRPIISNFDKWVRKNPFLNVTRKRFVVIGSPVMYREGDRLVDLYTDDLVSDLPSDDSELVRLESAALRKPASGTIRSYNNDCIEFLYRHARSFHSRAIERKPVNRPDLEALEEITGRIRKRFGAELPISAMARDAAVHFLAQRSAWMPYFRLRRPQFVFLGVQSYGYEGLISAAQRCGATVAERQHGLVSNFHYGYHFPGCPVVPNRPEIYLMFGPGWEHAGDYPKNTKCLSYGFEPILKARQRLASGEWVKRPNLAVLSSDPFCHELLVSAIEAILTRDPAMTAAIRSHPGDPFDYAGEVRRRGLGARVTIASNLEPVHRFIATSEYVLTGPSTVTAEAMALSCKVICVALQYRSGMERLLQGTAVKFADSVPDIVTAFATVAAPTEDYGFFEPGRLNLLELIKSGKIS